MNKSITAIRKGSLAAQDWSRVIFILRDFSFGLIGLSNAFEGYFKFAGSPLPHDAHSHRLTDYVPQDHLIGKIPAGAAQNRFCSCPPGPDVDD